MSFKAGFVIDPHYSSSTPVSRKDVFSEAMMRKTEFIKNTAEVKKWDAVIIAGDTFTSAVITWKFFIELTDAFNKMPCPVYIIPGNHDMKHRRIDLMHDETPLGAMLRAGTVLDLTTNPVGPLTGMAYEDDASVPEVATSLGEHKWLICHQYIGEGEGWAFGSGGRLSLDSIDEGGYTGVVAGHDHVEYPVVYTEKGAAVYRFGALSRGTKHEYNLNRVPKIMSVVFNIGKEPSVELIEVPAESDVIKDSALLTTERSGKLKDFVTSLGDGSFKNSGRETASQALERVAKEQCLDKAVTHKIRCYFDEFGVI